MTASSPRHHSPSLDSQGGIGTVVLYRCAIIHVFIANEVLLWLITVPIFHESASFFRLVVILLTHALPLLPVVPGYTLDAHSE